jgi:Restriction endonuclease S subunits
MTYDWQILTLADIAEPEGGLVDGPFGSNLPASCYVEEGIPVLRGSNLTVGLERFKSNDFVYVSKETLRRLKRSECLPKDIIFTKKGTLGQTGIVPSDSHYERYLLSSNQMRLRVNTDLADPEYVYYWISSKASIEKIKRDSEYTGVPKINLDYLKKFPIVIPKLIIQKQISKILSGFEDKIDLNRQMNSTLEQIAQTLFKHWFIDFEFPDENGNPYKSSGGRMEDSELGEIPEGWNVKPIDEVADFLNGLALQKYPPESGEYLPVIKIRELKQGITEVTDKASTKIDEKYIISDGDILFSWSGSLECCIWCNGKGALNQHLFKVTSSNYPKWFCYLWINNYLPYYRHIAKEKATTMGHIQRHHLSETFVLVPTPEILEKMDEIISPLFEKTISNNLQARSCSNMRDSILPKLMSGKIRVKC